MKFFSGAYRNEGAGHTLDVSYFPWVTFRDRETAREATDATLRAFLVMLVPERAPVLWLAFPGLPVLRKGNVQVIVRAVAPPVKSSCSCTLLDFPRLTGLQLVV